MCENLVADDTRVVEDKHRLHGHRWDLCHVICYVEGADYARLCILVGSATSRKANQPCLPLGPSEPQFSAGLVLARTSASIMRRIVFAKAASRPTMSNSMSSPSMEAMSIRKPSANRCRSHYGCGCVRGVGEGVSRRHQKGNHRFA